MTSKEVGEVFNELKNKYYIKERQGHCYDAMVPAIIFAPGHVRLYTRGSLGQEVLRVPYSEKIDNFRNYLENEWRIVNKHAYDADLDGIRREKTCRR